MDDGYELFKDILGDIVFDVDINGCLHFHNSNVSSISMSYTNCKNCGAPLHFDENGKSKCEYCGTEYY